MSTPSNGINGKTDGQRIVEFNSLDASVQQLIQAAVAVRNNAYCPYSKFAVGAAIQLATGQIIPGCNVENATFAPSICAERSAMAHAISIGQRDFVAVAVVAQQEASFTAPCGVCRQSLSEFARPEMRVYLAKPALVRVLCTTLGELLPLAFDPIDVGDKKSSMR